ncbi:AAA family ATPase [Arthrobacter sp. CAN_C5]|uniref:AAA family ATPase n=1 Tax=Arthrobacter sp. CAN_C5 TaxID=2760706 RepID=UPI001AE46A1A|nr:AAA family ATPase [Arthrobacter sp. CAN_C5]MBP2218475.1 putative kinase [Arthrobacter sp. CAN_C5]
MTFALHCVFLNGTVGVGKTSTADALAHLLTAKDLPHAVIDLDWLRFAWPAPTDDPFNRRIELANLSAVIPNFRSAGARLLVLAGVIEGTLQRAEYERVLGHPLLVVRLEATSATVQDRLRGRHDPGDPSLGWHLDRATELQAILTHVDVDDAVISTEEKDPHGVASAVLGLIDEKWCTSHIRPAAGAEVNQALT